jgi:excisionase family DNA binding protein
MSTFSTREAAKKLGLDAATLSRYIRSGKIPAPKSFQVGKARLHSWTEQDVERVRALLPKIKNGRTTRHKKQAQKKQSKRNPKQ